MAGAKWAADPTAELLRRWGASPHERGDTSGDASCPDIWELGNGDIAIIGQDLTAGYRDRLPQGVSIDPGESLVVIPRKAMIAAKRDIPDA